MNIFSIGYQYYYYFTYSKLKKKSGKSEHPNPIPIGTRVHALLGLQQLLLMGSLFFEYVVVTKEPPKIEHPFVLFIPFIIWSVFDLWFFSEKKVKKHFLVFSSWSEATKKKWNRIMRCIDIAITVNFLIAMYFLTQFHK